MARAQKQSLQMTLNKRAGFKQASLPVPYAITFDKCGLCQTNSFCACMYYAVRWRLRRQRIQVVHLSGRRLKRQAKTSYAVSPSVVVQKFDPRELRIIRQTVYYQEYELSTTARGTEFIP